MQAQAFPEPSEPPSDEPRLPLLAAIAVSKAFGATQALSRATLSLNAGEIHCLLGENGAGKSTLGKIIGGLYHLDTGEIRVAGARLTLDNVGAARRAGIAIVHQELSLAPDLTVRENLCLGSERTFCGILHRRSEEADCRTLLDELGVDIPLDRRTGDLPATRQQMVEIAKALLSRPKLVVLDEPTSMLGAVEKARLFDLLRRLRENGTACLFITHHIEDVFEVGDKVSVMKDGVVVATLPVDSNLSTNHLLELLTGRAVKQRSNGQRRSFGPVRLNVAGIPAKHGGETGFTIAAGEIVGLYGVVGCGRERISEAIVGFARAPDLRIAVDDRPYQAGSVAAAARCGIGYLPSGRAQNCILPTRSVIENLMLSRLDALQRWGYVSGSVERHLAIASLAALSVKCSSPDAAIESLSGGNQQKTVLGRAMGRATRLLVLEDPTAGIDIGAKADVHEQIRARANDGVGILFLSSDLVETLRLCDTVYSVHGGCIVRRYDAPSLDDQSAVIADVIGRAESGSSFERAPSPASQRAGEALAP